MRPIHLTETTMKTADTVAPTAITSDACAPATAAMPVASPFEAPFGQVRDEAAALAPAELIPITFDVPSAVTRALGVLPDLRARRDAIAQLPDFDLARFDRLESYARAAGYAHAVYLATSQPAESLPTLHAAALTARDTLLVGAEALASKELLSRDRLAEIRAGQGYRDTAMDLIGLVAMFRAAWPTIAGRTAVDAEDLAEAEKLADRLLVAVGLRERGNPAIAEAADERRRAVTLFARAYEDVRRALTYLRWYHGDVETVAPSLYNRARSASGRDTDEPAKPAGTEDPAKGNVVGPEKPAPTPVRPSVPQDDPFIRA
jgi:hypothetical protein